MRLGCFDSVPYFRGADGVGVPCDYQTPYPYGFGVDAGDPLRDDLTEVKQAIAQIQRMGRLADQRFPRMSVLQSACRPAI